MPNIASINCTAATQYSYSIYSPTMLPPDCWFIHTQSLSTSFLIQIWFFVAARVQFGVIIG